MLVAWRRAVPRIVYEDPDPRTGFILVPDPKWKSHPDPQAVPKERWASQDPEVLRELSCLAICHDRSLGSLRDLRKRHLPLLQNILETGLRQIQQVYGVEPERIRVFVHYVPQFFHFHGRCARPCPTLSDRADTDRPRPYASVAVHFSRLSLMYGVEVERAHLLSDVMEKVASARKDDYYEGAAISYSVKKSEEAYQRLQQAGLFRAPR